MRYATRHLSILLSLPLLVLTVEAVTSAEEPRRRLEDAVPARSDLYDRFDPEQLGRTYLSQLERDGEFSVRRYLGDNAGELRWCVLCSVHEPAEPRSDQARILGTWKVVGSIGSEETPMQAIGTEVEFTADFMILKPKSAKDPGEWLKLGYKLDPAPDPKHIDTRHRLGSKEKPIVQLGIYSLENGELRFGLASAGQPRPTEFPSIPQAFVLKRADEP